MQVKRQPSTLNIPVLVDRRLFPRRWAWACQWGPCHPTPTRVPGSPAGALLHGAPLVLTVMASRRLRAAGLPWSEQTSSTGLSSTTDLRRAAFTSAEARDESDQFGTVISSPAASN